MVEGRKYADWDQDLHEPENYRTGFQIDDKEASDDWRDEKGHDCVGSPQIVLLKAGPRWQM